MSGLEINHFGSMMDSSASVFTCRCGKCVDCIKRNWKTFFSEIESPSNFIHPRVIDTKDIGYGSKHQNSDNSIDSGGSGSSLGGVGITNGVHKDRDQNIRDLTSSRNRDQTNLRDTNRGISSPGTPCYPTDVTECYKEAIKLKRDADKLCEQRLIQPCIHKYIQSLIRFLYTAHEKRHDDLSEAVRLMIQTTNLCNAAMDRAHRHGYTKEFSLILLLKAFAYYLVYQMQSPSINVKHAIEARDLDSETKKFIEFTYYLSRSLQYLTQIAEHYPQSPMHIHFYDVRTMELLNFVDGQLREIPLD